MNSSSEYLLLFRGSYWKDDNMSAADMESALGSFMNWLDELKAEGRVVGAHPLMDGGTVVTASGVMLDGPFAESKEAIGGYFQIRAADMEEAIEIARRCPTLSYGAKVEVRQISPQCPIAWALDELPAELAHA